MATFYVDPIGGNDASAGTSFATRWQSLTNGATAARIAPGDTIRIIASPDPVNTGISGTWGVVGVTLPSAVTSNIYTSGTWTAATTNVTLSTSISRKLGATSVSVSPTVTFTTGKAAYLTLSTTDYSAYQQVSFWINMTAGSMTADGDISIRLCSDTIGDVTVNTIAVPRMLTTSVWYNFTVNLGTALGSTIQSVALYIDQDRGAQTFLLNNIFATKSTSSVDAISLTSLIGRGGADDPWFPIQSIDGTAIVLEANPSSSSPNTTATTTMNPFSGSYNIFRNEPLQKPNAFNDANSVVSGWGTIQDTGTAGNPITFSGGWNRIDMSTQTGQTYISHPNTFGVGILIDSKNYINISRLNFSRCSFGFSTISTVQANVPTAINITSDNNFTASGAIRYQSFNSTYNIKNAIYTPIAIPSASTFQSGNSIIIKNSLGNNSINLTTITALYSNEYLQFDRMYGLAGDGTSSQTFFAISALVDSIFIFKNVSGLSTNGTTPISFQPNTVNNKIYIYDNFSVYAGNTAAPWISFIGAGVSGNEVYFVNTTPTRPTITNTLALSGSTSGGIGKNYIYGATNVGTVSLQGGQLVVVNSPYSAPTFLNAGLYNSNVSVTFANVAGSTSDQRTYYTKANILTDSSIRHTASGISWKMTQTSTTPPGIPTSIAPLTLPVAKIACNASALVTASVWVYRTDTTLTTNFICPGNQIAGVATDVVATASAAINTWEQLTITFTPSQQGVVELEVQCYGAAASVYVDDFSVSQA